MYWDMVLQEVLNKKSSKQNFTFTNIGEFKSTKNIKNSSNSTSSKKKQIKSAKPFKKYFLGEKFPKLYFTKREAECMVLLLKGKTINRTASEMKLSPRTVEFYLKNMKNKIHCRTKFELIELIQNSDFLKNLDF